MNWHPSITNPNAAIVNVSGVDEARLARLPNLAISQLNQYYSPPQMFPGNVYVKNVSETGEGVGTFDIEISGRRKSDGQYEVIETRTVNGLPLFGKVKIDFPPDKFASLKLDYTDLKFIVDPGNLIRESDKTDNQATIELW